MATNQSLTALRQIVLDKIAHHEGEITRTRGLHEEEIAKCRSTLAEFEKLFGIAAETTPKRRGPKPGFKRVAAQAATRPGPKPKVKAAKVVKVKGRPGPKPRANAAAPKRRNQVTNAATGRREVLDNMRPKLKDAITQILRKDTMNASMIYEKLNAKGWLPNSSEPRVYIAQFLSATKDAFEKVPSKGRGFYRAIAAKATPVEKTDEAVVPTTSTSSDTDATLADAGIIPPAN